MSSIGVPELFLVPPLALLVASAVFYLLALRRALSVCAPGNRTLPPALVWLLLLPLFNFFWHFVVVVNVFRTMRNEFKQRHLGKMPLSALSLGLAMCILSAAAFAPGAAPLATLGAFACWVAYWVKVARDTRTVTLSRSMAAQSED